MQEKVKNLWIRTSTHIGSHKLRYSVIGIIVIIILLVSFGGGKAETVVTDAVKRQNLERTVLATGQVTSVTDLDLSFTGSGVVRGVYVSVGDTVSVGKVLATLDNKTELASVTSAQGALALAEANYQKILAGASSEEITLAEVALANAKTDLANTTAEQTTIVENAHRALLNSGISVYQVGNGTSSVGAPTITGSYNGSAEGTITISTYTTGAGGYFNATGLVSAAGPINTSPTALGSTGLFITFPQNYAPGGGITWTVPIPNTQADTYVSNLNAYMNALSAKDLAIASAQALVAQKEAELNVKKAEAPPADLSAAEANIISAKGGLASAQAAYERTIIRAPANGTITSVDIKYGEIATALKEAIVLEDVGNLYIEADINESDIVLIRVDEPVTVTFDAFGPSKVFLGTVVSVDPSATITEGVVNYKIKAALRDTDPNIRPDMNADMTVTAGGVTDVLTIPRAAVIDEDGKTYVRVVTNEKKKTYEKKEVTLGFLGDGNIVEVANGLSEGEVIVVSVH